MKKLIQLFSVIMILFNFIFVNNVYAEGGFTSKAVQNSVSDPAVFNDALNGSDEKSNGSGDSNTVSSILGGVLNIFPASVRLLIVLFARRGHNNSKNGF